MSWKQKIKKAVVYLALGSFTVAIGALAVLITVRDYPKQWLTALNVVTSALLSAALVTLYYRQSSILQSQKDLKETEMNLEVRKQHTEALRERVVAWHGNAEPTQVPDSPLLTSHVDDDRGLPRVTSTGFTSAPNTAGLIVPSEDKEFNAIPVGLRDDPYLNDFIDNHAGDVKQVTEDVERYQREFDNLRSQFADSLHLDFGSVDESYEIEWTSQFPFWIFSELLILCQKPKEELSNKSARDYIESMTEDVEISSVRYEDNSFTLRHSDDGPPVAFVKMTERELINVSNINEDVMVYFRSRFQRELEPVVEDWPDQTIARALRELQQGEEAIEELEQKLEEYAGRPIYDGDCKYIDNADVSNW